MSLIVVPNPSARNGEPTFWIRGDHFNAANEVGFFDLFTAERWCEIMNTADALARLVHPCLDDTRDPDRD